MERVSLRVTERIEKARRDRWFFFEQMEVFPDFRAIRGTHPVRERTEESGKTGYPFRRVFRLVPAKRSFHARTVRVLRYVRLLLSGSIPRIARRESIASRFGGIVCRSLLEHGPKGKIDASMLPQIRGKRKNPAIPRQPLRYGLQIHLFSLYVLGNIYEPRARMERFPRDDEFAHGGRSIEKTKRKRINTVKAEVAFHAERAKAIQAVTSYRSGDVLTHGDMPRRESPAITDPFTEERMEFRRLSAFFDTELPRLKEEQVLARILEFARNSISPNSATFLIAKTGAAYRHFH